MLQEAAGRSERWFVVSFDRPEMATEFNGAGDLPHG
jgi:hypothetical protein